MGIPVELFNVLWAEEGQPPLEFLQVFLAHNVFFAHVGTPEHNQGILSDSLFVLLSVRIGKSI
jgi:hypothetical protein